eukprot:1340-Heterococcus_DN1.PRE.11
MHSKRLCSKARVFLLASPALRGATSLSPQAPLMEPRRHYITCLQKCSIAHYIVSTSVVQYQGGCTDVPYAYMLTLLLQAHARTTITNASAEAYAILLHHKARVYALAAISQKETRMRSYFVVDPSDGWSAMYIKHSDCPLLCCCACVTLLSSAQSSAITQSQNALL